MKKDPLAVVAVPDHFDVVFSLGPDAVRVARCDTAQAAADWIATVDLSPKTLAQSIARIGAARAELTDLCSKHPDKLDAADGPIPPKPPKGQTP